MARKKPHEEHENHERYLVTYSDLITLLLAFFIILYAMSASDPNKFNDVARALRLGFLPTSEQTSLASLPLQSPNARTKTTQEEVQMMKSVKENNDLEKIKKKIDQKIRENPEMIDKVSTSLTKEGLYIVLSDEILFDSGSAVVKKNANGILSFVSSLIIDVNNPIKISGHTDNIPIKNSVFPSNWELSTSRATSVLQKMIVHLPENVVKRFSASGFGQYKPIANNKTSEGRKVNRRVEILIERVYKESSESKKN